MTRAKKHRLVFIIAIWIFAFISGTAGTVAAAETEESYGDFTYTTDREGFITITGYHGDGGTVVIPSVMEGGTVTTIGENVFYDCVNLKKISIPESVINIGRGAFEGCSELTDITIPDGIVEIEDYVFADCSKLSSIAIPGGVTSIGQGAFWGCVQLTSVTLPESVTDIGDAAFVECTLLNTVYIPENTTNIGTYAFAVDEDAWYSHNPANKRLTIYGILASTAQTYADKSGISFTAIETYPHIHTCSKDWMIEKEATCTEDGLKNRKCLTCNESVKSQKIPAVGHTFTGWEVKTGPTCTEAGEKSHICTVCGLMKTEIIDALGHSYTAQTVKATCAAQGYTLYTCSVCMDSYKDRYTSENECLVCGGDGYTSKKKCSKCSGGYTTVRIPSDCSRCSGKGTIITTTTEIVTCALCQGTGVTYSSTLHTYVTCIGGCNGTGLYPYTQKTETECTSCKGSGKIHTSVQVKCSVCNGTTYIFNDCSYCNGTGRTAPGHRYGSWAVAEAASCTEDGSRTRVCSDCGDTQTAVIAKTGHSYATTRIDDGTIVEKCSVCGSIKSISAGVGTDSPNSSPADKTENNVKGKSVLSKTTISAIKNNAGKKLTVRWKKVKGAKGYEVYRAISKNGKYRKVKTITRGSKLSFTDKKLSRGKTYFYKIRAYRIVNDKKVYGEYSTVKHRKVKK